MSKFVPGHRMGQYCNIKEIFHSQPTIEGAGVHLKRAFGFYETPRLDPFLLLDDFHCDNPARYIAGFPWHPHRGIETITYLLEGFIEHGDSLGNSGMITPGDVQWMTAGSGIIHQEMPRIGGNNQLWGFQLWSNLPADKKMMKPRYRGIASDSIPVIEADEGVRVRVISGVVNGVQGPVRDIVTDPHYFDIRIPAGKEFTCEKRRGYTTFAYIIHGTGTTADTEVQSESVLLFNEGDTILFTAGDEDLRYLLVSGKPLGEPLFWRGPFVTNSTEELELAFREYQNGTFIKNG